MNIDDLKPGVYVRIRNGHHRGAIVEIIAVYGRNVQFRVVTKAHGKGKGKETARLLQDFILRNADLVEGDER